MAKVIIAEKPSVAKNIADAYNIKNRKDGYFEGNGYYITWAFGHLLQLYDAKDYDENMKGWRFEKFPFIPESFLYKVKCDSADRTIEDKGAKKQLGIIKSLIDKEDVDSVPYKEGFMVDLSGGGLKLKIKDDIKRDDLILINCCVRLN